MEVAGQKMTDVSTPNVLVSHLSHQSTIVRISKISPKQSEAGLHLPAKCS